MDFAQVICMCCLKLACNMWQSYFRCIRPGVQIGEFLPLEAFEGKCSNQGNAETWAGLLLSVFTMDLYCKHRQQQSCKLALVMWLEGASGRPDLQQFLSDVDILQGTVPLHGCETPHYDVIEVDRILGPEYIIPAFSQPAHEKYLMKRDFRKEPISKNEIFSTISLARNIGSAYPTTIHHDDEDTD